MRERDLSGLEAALVGDVSLRCEDEPNGLGIGRIFLIRPVFGSYETFGGRASFFAVRFGFDTFEEGGRGF